MTSPFASTIGSKPRGHGDDPAGRQDPTNVRGDDLAIVIVNWNTAALLHTCLSSLLATVESGPTIIVVDNGSSDGSADMVAAEFPRVRLLRNQANRGFSAANNQGIRMALDAGARYVALLNSDTEATPAALAALAAFLADNPGVGAVGPRLVRADGSLQPYAYGADPSLPYLATRALRQAIFHRYMHDWGDDAVRQVDWASGACLMARREAWEAAGLLDEAIFMYFEDNDWCLRARRAGWLVMHDPRVTVIHLGGQSLAQNPAARQAYDRSLRYFYAKHYGPVARLLLPLFLALYRGRQ